MDDQSLISRLLGKMDASPGFAGLGASVKLISQLGEDSDGDSREITAAILRDAALTAKLLRIANSSRNARAGRNISTIDQALVMLGLNTVKSVALSLALLDSLSRKPQSKLLHAEIVAAYFCGSLAYEITRINSPRASAQEAQVCGLMQNLGRMMATYYLFEEIEKSRVLQAEENLGESDAIARTLGTGFAEIGGAIAAHWCLPDVLQNSLKHDNEAVPPRAFASVLDWHPLCASFCQKITDTLFRSPENREKIDIGETVGLYRGALNLRDDRVREWIEKCLADTDALLADMSFPCTVDEARQQLRKASERVLDRLAEGDTLTRASIGDRSPVEVIQQALRLLHDHCAFDRTLICLADRAGLTAIAGVGRNASVVTSKFRCHGAKPDLFRTIAARQLDLFIADVKLPSYAKLIPDWYHQFVGARSFMMLPLVHDGKLLAVVYGDYAQPHAKPPAEAGDACVREWREEMIQALVGTE